MSQEADFILAKRDIPYYSQLASPELVEAVFDQGFDPGCDPRWQEYGAKSTEEYTYWAARACGAACLKMVVEAFGGSVHTMMDWIQLGLACQGYRTTMSEQGKIQEIGWDHQVLATLICNEGISAQAQVANPDDLTYALKTGKLAIVSVSYELGTYRPITRRGGHLCVLCGAEFIDGKPIAYLLHNPSGRTSELRANARVEAGRFEAAYSGRGILAGPASA